MKSLFAAAFLILTVAGCSSLSMWGTRSGNQPAAQAASSGPWPTPQSDVQQLQSGRLKRPMTAAAALPPLLSCTPRRKGCLRQHMS